MFQILIVDDERIILNGCRMMIEKKMELPFPVDILTANHVDEALLLLADNRPDLIITDIRMPMKNGFELIKELQARGHTGHIVILTSHADFEYARSALRLNVTDFLLKPIKQEELKKIILTTWQHWCEQDKEEREEAFLDLLYMMLYSTSELSASKKLLQQIFPETYFTVIVLSPPDQLPEASAVREIIQTYYPYCHCYSLYKQKQLVAVCNHKFFRVRLEGLLHELHALAGSHCPIGISITSNSIDDMHSLYTNAVQRIFYQEAFGNNQALTETSFFSYQDCVQIFLEQNPAQVQVLFNSYLSRLNLPAPEHQSPAYWGHIYHSFFQNLALYFKNIGIECEVNTSPPQLIDSSSNLIRTIVGEIKKIRVSLQQKESSSEAEQQMKRIFQFIKLNYTKDISLDDLAEAVNLSPTYICTLFRKTAGTSFLSSLHQERLREAKRLLRESSLPIEVIAGQVGYSSSSQFGRIFKKYENKSPSDFRRG